MGNLAVVVVRDREKDRNQYPKKLAALLRKRLVQTVAERHAYEAFGVVFAKLQRTDPCDRLETLHLAPNSDALTTSPARGGDGRCGMPPGRGRPGARAGRSGVPGLA